MRDLQALAVEDQPALVFGRHEIEMRPASIATDIAALRAAALTQNAAAMVTLIDGRPMPLLAGLEPIGEEYDDWLARERAHRQEERRELVLATAKSAMAAGGSADAFCLAKAMLKVDPLDEEAATLAIETAAGPGRHGALRTIYKRHAQAVRRELGENLPPAMVASYQSLLARSTLPTPPNQRHHREPAHRTPTVETLVGGASPPSYCAAPPSLAG